MMESTSYKFRYVLALLVGALATAASLRHLIHTYGGLPREEIRAGALAAIPIVALAIVFFRRKRQLRRKRQSTALPRDGA
jgi:ABC-type proline/glycine betaine transport system permease subunit